MRQKLRTHDEGLSIRPFPAQLERLLVSCGRVSGASAIRLSAGATASAHDGAVRARLSAGTAIQAVRPREGLSKRSVIKGRRILLRRISEET